MICDWLAAGIVYGSHKPSFRTPYSEPLEYYNKCKSFRIFHPDTQRLIETYLKIIDTKGINEFCRRVKKCNGWEKEWYNGKE
jgi:hypothetical protein